MQVVGSGNISIILVLLAGVLGSDSLTLQIVLQSVEEDVKGEWEVDGAAVSSGLYEETILM